jgi:hypothetical protein
MKFEHREYREEAGDFTRLCRFIAASRAGFPPRTAFSMPRFIDWKYGLYPSRIAAPGFWARNARLWMDGFGDVAAAAVSENGGGDFFIVTSPGYPFLYETALEWVHGAWSPRATAEETELMESQARERGILERAGFRQVAANPLQFFDLARGKNGWAFPLEPGYSFIDMESRPEYTAQRLLRMDAFDGLTAPTPAELQQRLLFHNNTHQSPFYHPAADLCVRAPDGTHVAGCEALHDTLNGTAELERVCTRSTHRRRGFARAVIGECLRRLQDMGVRSATVGGYSAEAKALYASLGADAEAMTIVMRREDA